MGSLNTIEIEDGCTLRTCQNRNARNAQQKDSDVCKIHGCTFHFCHCHDSYQEKYGKCPDDCIVCTPVLEMYDDAKRKKEEWEDPSSEEFFKYHGVAIQVQREIIKLCDQVMELSMKLLEATKLLEKERGSKS